MHGPVKICRRRLHLIAWLRYF